jgi:hypothetical protein
VLLRPENLRLTAGGGDRIELIEFYGHDTMYLVRTEAGGMLHVRAGSAPEHARGANVTVRYQGPPAPIYPASSESAEHEHPVLTTTTAD